MDNRVRTFIDTHNRQIEIGGDGTSIVAEHNGTVIGRFEFDQQENDQNSVDILTNCNIESNYQRSGIGVNMIRLAEDWYNNFCIVDHFTLEGAAFMKYCQQNIFQKEHSTIKDGRY